MPEHTDHISELIVKSIRSELSVAEEMELKEWAQAKPGNRWLLDRMMDESLRTQDIKNMATIDVAAAEEKIVTKLFRTQAPVYEMKSRKNWLPHSPSLTLWWASAAAVIIIFAIGAYLWTIQQKEKPSVTQTSPVPVQNDVAAPSVTRATITLSNGQKVFVDSATAGTIATEQGASIKKLGDGSIVYNAERANADMAYNTLVVPRGSQIASIVLSDGTKVFLNAASTLRYPVAFIGRERRVEVSGEAYFEVTNDASKPFIVSKDQTSVQVLGTRFNVNAYSEEQDIKITLLEGSVKVSNRKTAGLLKPGQQARISEDIDVKEVNVDEVMSWRDGIFLLDNMELQTLMRQVSRWYDVDVKYEGKKPSRKFGGGVSKDQPLSKILEMLRRYGIDFQVEGKTVIVKQG